MHFMYANDINNIHDINNINNSNNTSNPNSSNNDDNNHNNNNNDNTNKLTGAGAAPGLVGVALALHGLQLGGSVHLMKLSLYYHYYT